jgi:hypothetical protein
MKKLHPDTPADILCPMCGKVMNPDLFHILSKCKHGGPATMLDRHNRVEYARREAIKIVADKTVLSFAPDIPEGRRHRSNLTLESSKVVGKGAHQKTMNGYHLIEIGTPWSCKGQYGNALTSAYNKKVTKSKPLIASIEMKKPGCKVDQTMIIVSPTGALYR